MGRLFAALRRRPLLSSQESDLGNVLLRMGAITASQLESVVAQQKRGEQAMLGALLLAAGCIDEKKLSEALALQAKMRSGKEAEAMLDLVEEKTRRARVRLLKLEEVPG